MQYNIKTTISDFEKFIEFIESERPVLSSRRIMLGKKDLFKLNALLENKMDVNAPNYNQNHYPVIDLMFSIVLDGKLYTRDNDEDRRIRLIKTPALDSFQSLNEYEKYAFILQTYWTKYDFKEEYDDISPMGFYDILNSISNCKDGHEIERIDDCCSMDEIYIYFAKIFYHLNFFGFGELKLFDDMKNRIESFCLNAFGIKMSKLLLTKAFPYWNNDNLEEFYQVLDIKSIDKKGKPFDIFRNFFEKGLVVNTVKEFENVEKRGVYTFKVSLPRNVWRKISLSYKHTLQDLHIAIQEAFCFDNDHLYAFFIGGNQNTGKPVYCEYAEEDGPTAEKTSIAALNLYKGEKMLYLFDFGDEWKFDITLMKIDNDAPLPLKPMIVESKGEAPEQY